MKQSQSTTHSPQIPSRNCALMTFSCQILLLWTKVFLTESQMVLLPIYTVNQKC